MKNILVIAAHPDDLEFGCAATITKFKEQGANVDVFITVRPGVEITPGRNKDIVEKELNKSMEFLGMQWRTMNIADRHRPHLQCTPDVITELDRFRKDKHYDLVITNDPGDYHQDHVETFNIANSFCRKNVDALWTMEIAPYANRNTTFKPNVFVDVSDHIKTKLMALSFYESYMTPELYDSTLALAMHRATQIKDAEHAEAFQQHFKIIK